MGYLDYVSTTLLAEGFNIRIEAGAAAAIIKICFMQLPNLLNPVSGYTE
jgi:hypothetical protein